MDEQRKPGLFEKGHPVSDRILEWWEGVKDSKGDKAELRRSKNLQEIQLSSAYQRCYWQLKRNFPGEQKASKEQMAIIIGLAAHVENNDSDKKGDQGDDQANDFFGYQIGRGESQPRLSELRFQRLLKIDDREKLYRFLVQVIRMLERSVSLMDVLSIAYYWGDATKTSLAYKYYEKASLEK